MLAEMCRDLLAQHKQITLRDLGSERCAIVSFTIEGADAKGVVAAMSRSGFAIGASQPSSTRLDAERRSLPTLLRIAPHYYNTEDEIAQAVEALPISS